ncbi:protein phosphatase 1 regulatory subunit 12A isoform X2 [Condylostylus longicornis]|uniref:protein phosphatase 1 regulatory subunit 12A isoform X2 n=1 Tax=Condylostylus longicornis TaxID=2530218 RepID=UPI00244E46C5|nr:protein phosphatase 1 regulatory subunit 12A isoform X2 [Condylostylus longicornis]
MSSFDTRNNSALMKRAEQLKRWEESDTNREPTKPKNSKGRRIKFPSGCVFLAACVAGDKDEVIQLLDSGADINTTNIDGLTALHQACIDDNLEMVEFLLEYGADINRQDNEGWTPLHATASCGSVSIARYLAEHGADLTIVNNDGDLAVDIAPPNTNMSDYLQELFESNQIDCEKCRQLEEQTMLADAKRWLRSDASEADAIHPKTGATPLHVAAAKGYTKVLSLLLAGRANIDKQDNDGWTPLHAASHWGQREAVEMLVDAQADMEIRNYSGQNCIDVADEPKMRKFMEELKANRKVFKRPSSQIRNSDRIENQIDFKKVRVEVKPVEVKDKINDSTENTKIDSESEEMAVVVNENDNVIKPISNESGESDSDLSDSTESSHSTSVSESEEEISKPPSEPVKKTASEIVDEDAPWRRNSARTRNNTQEKVPEVEVKSSESDVILRRTQSFENDQKFYQKYHELRARIKANSCPILPATQTTGVLGAVNSSNNNYSVQRSASLKDHRNFRKPTSPPVSPSAPAAPVQTNTTALVRSQNDTQNQNHVEENHKNDMNSNDTKVNSNETTNPFRVKISPGTMIKNFFKSFVPPVRDEESETQRKAHAKRVRETRRSTQGVTLDEIKSAEELVKKKNLNSNNVTTTTNNNSTNSQSQTTTTTTSTISSSNPTVSTVTTTTTSLLGTGGINDRVPSTATSDISVVIPVIQPPPTIDTTTSDKKEITTTYTTTTSPYTIKLRENRNSGNFDKNDDNNLQNNKTTLGTSLNIESPSKSISSIPISDSVTTSSSTLNDRKSMKDDIITSSTVINVPNNNNNNNNSKKTDNMNIKTINHINSANISDQQQNSDQQHQQDTTLTTTVRLREKRSLFDIDNANSLTLADKLRNEANKYTDDSGNIGSNTTITSPTTTTARSIIGNNKTTGTLNNLEDSTINNLLNNRKSDSMSPSPVPGSGGGIGTGSDRRPSWRLKFDSGNKFKLEDATSTYPPSNNTIITSAPAVMAAANQRRSNPISTVNQSSQQPARPISAPPITQSNTDNNTNERIRSDNNNRDEDKENDKENDSRSGQSNQAVIQRRRKHKRRSTGVVHVDMDDIDPDKQDSPGDNEEKESGTDRTSRSRLTNSTNSLADSETGDSKTKDSNGEIIDYKALWEAEKLENDKLRKELKTKSEELNTTKTALDKQSNSASKNTQLSELDKREKRALERKISEMEEELKQLDFLKTENQRLKEENGALIRVISKLSK